MRSGGSYHCQVGRGCIRRPVLLHKHHHAHVFAGQDLALRVGRRVRITPETYSYTKPQQKPVMFVHQISVETRKRSNLCQKKESVTCDWDAAPRITPTFPLWMARSPIAPLMRTVCPGTRGVRALRVPRFTAFRTHSLIRTVCVLLPGVSALPCVPGMNWCAHLYDVLRLRTCRKRARPEACGSKDEFPPTHMGILVVLGVFWIAFGVRPWPKTCRKSPHPGGPQILSPKP